MVNHMKNIQSKYLMRNAKALMDFQLTGRLPSIRKPLETPLWVCLNDIPPRLRAVIVGIKLNPALGYNCNYQFNTAEQLFQYLGGNNDLIEHQSLPSERYAIRAFQKVITLDDILENAASYPPSIIHHP